VTAIAAVQPVVVGVSPKANWTFASVTTAGGDTGWGECSLNGWEPMLVAFAAMLESRAMGCSIDDTDRLPRFLPRSPGGTVAHAVRSAIEQACTDLRASRAGVPIHALLDGPDRPAYQLARTSTAA